MYQFTFHGVDRDRDQLYYYARARDQALKTLGPRVLDSIVPGLSRQNPAADALALSFDHLLTQGNKKSDCSIDSSMNREERIKYALDTASASQLVEQSKLSLFSFLDQRSVDCLTWGSMDLSSRRKDKVNSSDKIYESFLEVTNYEDLVQLASNGLNVYHSITPATCKVIQDASKLAANTPTPHSTAEDKKVWDKFVNYAKCKGFHPLEATEQDVITWLEHRARITNLSWHISLNGDTKLANH